MRGLIHFTTLACALALGACNNEDAGGGPVSEAPAVPLIDAGGQIIGEVRGGDSDEGATLVVNARGLLPGEHGIHIHDVGVCDPPDFATAGSHWNPTGKQHGGRNPNGAHAGDLQNVRVADDGILQVRIVVPRTYLSNAGRDAQPGAQEILDASGAALVIHSKADDYRTDPSGNSGDRIACAVLGGPDAGAAAMTETATNAQAAPQGNEAANAAGTEANAVGNAAGY